MRAVLNAKTLLVQAIQAAEQETGGKAIDSSVENENGTLTYRPGQERQLEKVLVDQAGNVTKSTPEEQQENESEQGGD